MSSASVELLRKQLRERFPEAHEVVSTGRREAKEDFSFGNLPIGMISEVMAVGSANGAGVGMLLWEMLQQVPQELSGCDIGLIDATDSFDPASFLPGECARFLWLRCGMPMEALKAADLLLRDGNLPLVVMDASGLMRREMTGIADSVWWRLKQAVGASRSRLVVFSQYPMVPCAAVRLVLSSSYSLADFDLPRAELSGRLRFTSERLKRVN